MSVGPHPATADIIVCIAAALLAIVALRARPRPSRRSPRAGASRPRRRVSACNSASASPSSSTCPRTRPRSTSAIRRSPTPSSARRGASMSPPSPTARRPSSRSPGTGAGSRSIEVSVGRDVGELSNLLNAAIPGNDIHVRTVAEFDHPDRLGRLGRRGAEGARHRLRLRQRFLVRTPGTSISVSTGSAGGGARRLRRQVDQPARARSSIRSPSAASIRSACG